MTRIEEIYHHPQEELGETWILRLPQDNEFITSLLKFCQEKGINAAWFWALGGAKKVEVGRFNFRESKYESKTYEEDLEIISAWGNVGVQDGKLITHPHAAFARADLSVIGGHLSSLIVQGTCEIYLTTFNTKFMRTRGEVGLKLLTPPDMIK